MRTTILVLASLLLTLMVTAQEQKIINMVAHYDPYDSDHIVFTVPGEHINWLTPKERETVMSHLSKDNLLIAAEGCVRYTDKNFDSVYLKVIVPIIYMDTVTVNSSGVLSYRTIPKKKKPVHKKKKKAVHKKVPVTTIDY